MGFVREFQVLMAAEDPNLPCFGLDLRVLSGSCTFVDQSAQIEQNKIVTDQLHGLVMLFSLI